MRITKAISVVGKIKSVMTRLIYTTFNVANQNFPALSWTVTGTPTTAEILSNQAHIVCDGGSEGIRQSFANISGRRYKFTVKCSTVSGNPCLDCYGITFDETGTRKTLAKTTDFTVWGTANRTATDYIAIQSFAGGASEFSVDEFTMEY